MQKGVFEVAGVWPGAVVTAETMFSLVFLYDASVYGQRQQRQRGRFQ